MNKIAIIGRSCQIPWHELSRLVQEAISLGCVVKSVDKMSVGDHQPDIRLPLTAGHKFYKDCLREEEARVLEWLIRKHPENCWFITLTFRDYIKPEKPLSYTVTQRYDGVKPSAERCLAMWLSRLNQAHKAIPGAALLKSVHATEWQQRDVIHYHLLIYGNRLGSLSRKRWEFRWRMISGGYAANYDAELKAAPYLVKHQIKDRPGGNLDLGGSWRGINPPRSVSCGSSAPNGSRGVG